MYFRLKSVVAVKDKKQSVYLADRFLSFQFQSRRAANQAGRFPLYVSLDLQVTKGFQIPFIFKDKRIRAGVVLFNLTNRFNPRDLQNNITSPHYGQFYNSLGTAVKAKFDFDF